MAQMSIDKDIKAALDEGKLTWEQAGELRTLRRKLKPLRRKKARLEKDLIEAVEAMDGWDARVLELEERMNVPLQAESEEA